MFRNIKTFFKQIFESRILFLAILFIAMAICLLLRLFQLQIVNGADSQSSYLMRVIKTRSLSSTRGNIFDRNGKLLAYNELAYGITIEDNGSYTSDGELSATQVKNRSINEDLAQILHTMDKNGDEIDNDFSILLNESNVYEFTVSGTKLQRFRADIYGKTSIDDLGYDEKLGYDTAQATPDQMMDYLSGERCFDISDEYSKADRYRIAIIRYRMRQNSYQKYIATKIASNVSEETVAYVSEHANELQGVEVTEDTIRRYNDSKYFAHLIGYTGQIDEEEYIAFGGQDEDSEYSRNDTVGKSGIEQYMDKELKGKKGEEKLYVDNMGKELETIERTEPVAGNDVYLSIDMDLQEAVYDLLEQEIAGIVYSKIINAKEYKASSAANIKIPINDVYYALLNNNIISIDHFAAEDASETEQKVYECFCERQKQVLSAIKKELTKKNPAAYEDLGEDMQVYLSYIVSMLMDKEHAIIVSSKIDWNDETYIAWKNDAISLQEYLYHVINQQWFDITKFSTDARYSDSEEFYELLVTYILERLETDEGFSKRIYKQMLRDEVISGTDICLILYDQEILDYDDELIAELKNRTLSPFTFMMERIKNLEITPAQLALDPCTGSCVVTDVKTGELLACVTYPGYDNNRLANTVDSAYFAALMADLSSPFYNNATQQKTAPGSTFKMVTATAGLAEGVITTTTKIQDKGRFERVEDGPKCWAYPGSTHGKINVSEALRDSCNYFFYELGWQFSQVGDNYVESAGINILTKYAQMYGLGDKTGIETVESAPEIADSYPITAAIGQSNHNYTTIVLARYVTAVANSGTVYNYTLLNKLTDNEGNVLETYAPTIHNEMTEISSTVWDAIHKGNRMVVESLDSFNNFGDIEAAGKTGTAQQVKNRPNHALFVGYAPYDNPEISIATRIAYGYTSHNAADVSADIMRYYFQLNEPDELLTGTAAHIGTSTNRMTD